MNTQIVDKSDIIELENEVFDGRGEGGGFKGELYNYDEAFSSLILYPYLINVIHVYTMFHANQFFFKL